MTIDELISKYEWEIFNCKQAIDKIKGKPCMASAQRELESGLEIYEEIYDDLKSVER